MISRIIFLALIGVTLGQYFKDTRNLFDSAGLLGGGGGGGGQQGEQQRQQEDQNYYYKNKKVPPQIISHKQSQNHDGQFKYAFHAENGLAQGEVISPDGTRNGGYTYIDPSGKKIMVKYSAGKEGFRILDSSDHIPKALYAGQQAQQSGGGYSQSQGGGGLSAYSQYSGGQAQGGGGGEQEGKRGGGNRERYTKIHIPRVTEDSSDNLGGSISGSRDYQQPKYQSNNANNVDESNDPQYHDAPGKPYSFGGGYQFEFNG